MRDLELGPVAYDYEKITASGTAVALDPDKVEPANGIAAQRVTLNVETAAVRIRFDGTAPTATDGVPIASGASFVLDQSANIKKLQIIAQTGSPVVHVVYWQ